MKKGIDTQLDRWFTLPFEDTKEQVIEGLRDSNIKKYRLRSIFSGDMLESEAYPLWNTYRSMHTKNIALSRPQQQSLNNKNIRKKITRLLNANFTQDDIWITVGYKNGEVPSTEEQAYKDIVNYIRRLHRYSQKQGLLPLKYVYVTEYSQDTRVHHHLVINLKDRDMVEKLWKKGLYPQARRLMPNDYGLEGLARYISKDPRGKKSYGYSLNLHKSWEKPYAKTADYKLSRRKAAKIAQGEIDPKEYYEKLYPGYEFLDLEVQYSSFVSGCYLYARLRRKPTKTVGKKERRNISDTA